MNIKIFFFKIVITLFDTKDISLDSLNPQNPL